MTELQDKPSFTHPAATEPEITLTMPATFTHAHELPDNADSSTNADSQPVASNQASTEPTANGRKQTWWPKFHVKLRLADAGAILVVLAVVAILSAGTAPLFHLTVAANVESGIFLTALLIWWMLDLDLSHSRSKNIVGYGVAEYKRVIRSTLRVFGCLAIVVLVLKLDVPGAFFAVALPLGIVLLLLTRWLCRQRLARLREKGRYLTRAIVMGQRDDVDYVVQQLKSNLGVGYEVAGVVLSHKTITSKASTRWSDNRIYSMEEPIQQIVAKTGASAVIVAGPLPGGPDAVRQLGWTLEESPTDLILASSLTNVAGPRVNFRPVEGLPLIHVELPQFSGGKHLVKRAGDIAFSAAALLVLAPIFLVLALIVRSDSQGPVFFRQQRVGLNGQPFTMFKFRTMVTGADQQLNKLAALNQSEGPLFKIFEDPRVTRSGRWMRRYSLDELPQFLNVLLGNMSLVGPRPPLPQEVAKYQTSTRRRLLIKPGITGLWQVNGRSDLPWEEAVRLDLFYVENWSLTGDLIILWRTVKAVYEPRGAY